MPEKPDLLDNAGFWLTSAKNHATRAGVLLERLEVDGEPIDLDLVLAHALTAIALNLTHRNA